MALLEVVFNPTTRIVLVQPTADATPAGSVKIGEYEHDVEASDPLGTKKNHVLWHHIRDLMYLAGHQDMMNAFIQVKTSLGVVSIALSPDTVTVVKAATSQLTWAFTPTGATDKAVSFATSDPAVATVSASGLITAVDGGTANITITTHDGNKTDVTVVTVTVPVEFISLDASTGNLSLAGVKTKQISTFFGPANATNKSLTYASSDATKATVNSTGLVTGVAVGSATITVTAVGGATATFVATVTA